MATKKRQAPWLCATEKLLAQQKYLGGQRQAISIWSGQNKKKDLNAPSSSVANVVSTPFESFVIDIYSQAYRDSSLFTAGQIQHCKDQLVQITSDREILQMVNSYKLEFIDNPVQNQPPSSFTFDDTEIVLIENEIQDLLQLGVLIECEREQGDFLSNIFLRQKRMVLSE